MPPGVRAGRVVRGVLVMGEIVVRVEGVVVEGDMMIGKNRGVYFR